jgi:membrane fusion protein (multidrug efflux system)
LKIQHRERNGTVMGKWLFLGLIVLAVGLGGWGLSTGRFTLDQLPAGLAGGLFGARTAATPTPSAPPPAVAVEVATVRAGRITSRVAAIGTLQADQSVVIQPEIPGKVTRVGFREGDRVAAGAVLVELDRSVLAAELEQARAARVLAEANYRRADSLARQGSGTARARDEAAAAFETTSAAVELMTARLAKATIAAPFGGVVGLSDVTVGRLLAVGERIVNLESIDPLKVDFRVAETFLGAVQVGQVIALTVDAYPGRTFEGRVYAIDPLVDVNGRAIRLRARLPNADLMLRPGIFARVQLVVDVRDNALLLPEAAIVPQGQDRFVFRVEAGRAKWVKVTLGERRTGEIEVREGLKAGDTVVTAGQLKLFDGASVEVLPGGGPPNPSTAAPPKT